jgi:hypothetical protein
MTAAILTAGGQLARSVTRATVITFAECGTSLIYIKVRLFRLSLYDCTPARIRLGL